MVIIVELINASRKIIAEAIKAKDAVSYSAGSKFRRYIPSALPLLHFLTYQH